MLKHRLFALSMATIGAQSVLAAPFMPMDARGLAMGNTGVASAQRAHAPLYNPSLLSQAHEDDDFALLLPQIGVMAADEDEIIDDANDIIDNIVPTFEDLFEDNNTNNFSGSVDSLSQAASDLSAAIDNIDFNNLNTVKTASSRLQASLAAVDQELRQVNAATKDLNDALGSISGSPLRARLGIGATLAFPGKQFAAALSLNGTATLAGRALFSQRDRNLLTTVGTEAQNFVDQAKKTADTLETNLVRIDNPSTSTVQKQIFVAGIAAEVDKLRNYTSDAVDTAGGEIQIFNNGQVTQEAQDPQFDSQVQIKGVAVADLGLSIAREFEVFDEKVAIGVTPKLQKINTFHFATRLDNKELEIEADDIEDSRLSYTQFNLDIGASYAFGSSNQWIVGVVGKNLISKEFDVADTKVKRGEDATGQPAKISGGTITLNPQYRAGIAFNGDITTLTADIDLVENDPVAYEKATQYAALGAELDLFDTFQLRAGYRTNLAGDNDNVASVGLGLSPFGLHIDIAAMANPSKLEKEAGVALELGLYF